MNQFKVIAFEKIDNTNDLKAYLKYYGGMRDNRGFMHHYTSLSTVVNMFKGKTWHLSQASCMNDVLEYTNGDASKWSKLFFTSFMREDYESIGMWSMYGQPWNKGVKISIPKNIIVDWLTEKEIRVSEVNCRTKRNGVVIRTVKEFGFWYKDNKKISTCSVVSEKDFRNMYIPAYENLEGNYPESTNEVMLSVRTLKRLGIEETKIGMEIPIYINKLKKR